MESILSLSQPCGLEYKGDYHFLELVGGSIEARIATKKTTFWAIGGKAVWLSMQSSVTLN